MRTTRAPPYASSGMILLLSDICRTQIPYKLVRCAERPFRGMSRDGLCPRLGMTYRLKHHIDILRHVGNLHLERQRTRRLQEDVIELVDKTSRSKLDITEVKHDDILLTVLNEQPEIIHPQPGLKIG